ncbi:MAG TPA: transposase [Candidatus Tectomicrobia bacterium]
MPRKPRELIDGGCYHLIARGNNRQWLFTQPETFEAFLGFLVQAKRQYKAQCYHYCLMSNHFHLLARLDQGKDLPRFMQQILQGFSRWFRKRNSYWGHVWQGRYKSPRLADESYFLEAGRYIERNPIRAGIVSDLLDYPWSSYPYYAIGKPDVLVDEDPYYGQLGQTTEVRQQAYRNLVALESPYAPVLDFEFLERPF